MSFYYKFVICNFCCVVLSMFYFKEVNLVIIRVWVVKTLASQRSLTRKLIKEASREKLLKEAT